MRRVLGSLALVLLACAPPAQVVGTGQFELAMTADAGTWPVALAAGDFDGDGVSTMVIEAQPPFTYELRDGVLRAGTWPVGSRVSPMAVADLDGDSRPELIAGADEAFGRSDERGGWFSKFGWSVRSGPVGVVAGQLTEAAGPELVVSSEEMDSNGNRVGRLTVFEQRANPRYVSVSSFEAASCETPALVDFEADGAGEVVCPSYFTTRVNVLVHGALVTLTPPGVPDRAAACDLDGDGKQEAVITIRSHGLSLLRRSVSGDFEFKPLVEGASFCGDVHCADLDADGDQELMALCDEELLVMQIAADQVASTTRFPVRSAFRMIHADLTGDGVGDLVVSTLEERGTVSLFRALTTVR